MGVNGGQASVEWNDAQVDLLTRLFNDGLSATEIAGEMGCFAHCRDGGRSAVCGKLNRLGLMRGDRERARRMSAGGKGVGRKNIQSSKLSRLALAPKSLVERVIERRKREATGAMEHPEPVLHPEKFIARETPAEFLGIALLDLEPHHCRYPRDPFPYLFCGQPTVGGTSWCKHCLAIVSAPSRAPVERHYHPLGRSKPAVF